MAKANTIGFFFLAFFSFENERFTRFCTTSLLKSSPEKGCSHQFSPFKKFSRGKSTPTILVYSQGFLLAKLRDPKNTLFFLAWFFLAFFFVARFVFLASEEKKVMRGKKNLRLPQWSFSKLKTPLNFSLPYQV